MRKRVQIALAILLFALVCAIVWQVLHIRGPFYQGESASYWIATNALKAIYPEAAAKAGVK